MRRSGNSAVFRATLKSLAGANLIRRLDSYRQSSHRQPREICYRPCSTTSDAAELNVIKSPFPDVPETDGVTITEMIRELAGSWGDAKAYECAATGYTLTHNDVYKQSRSFAAALLATNGLRRGEVISVILPNIPQFAPILHGIWDAGMVASPMNSVYTPQEMARQIQNSGSKVVITIPAHLKTMKTMTPALKSIIVVGEGGGMDGVHSYNEMIKSSTLGVSYLKGSQINTKETLVLLPYSSGTTGLPKGVMLTHSNLATNLLQKVYPSDPLRVFRFESGQPQEKFIGLIPFFHAYGLGVFVLLAPATGAHVVCMPKFNHETLLNAFRTHKPTKLHLVPPLLTHMSESPGYGQEEFAAAHTVVVGAAPVSAHLVGKLLNKAGRRMFFQEGYGMTEMSPSTVLMPDTFGQLEKVGSSGIPIANTYVKVVSLDDDQKNLGRGETGEICVKGPQMMKGYWRNPEATASTIKNGWLHTGDVGYYDEDRCIFIVDRIKELIKVKGFQVAPAELEEVIRSYPGIADAAVVGIPASAGDELPRAYVILRQGVNNVTEQEIKDFVKREVAPYKQLHGGVEFVSEIPKSFAGKILRRALVKSYCEKMGIGT